ncbi:MAG: hypothetical protein HUJ71_00200 [Pseudobutyrivibrio sp.]|mgnify:CR=1 FL=1|nr:hypothetical protein [Pseudobutyrivibrio sp.]
MNKAQLDYLRKFCAGRNITEEEALQHVLVRDILEGLRDWHEPVYSSGSQSSTRCNCS